MIWVTAADVIRLHSVERIWTDAPERGTLRYVYWDCGPYGKRRGFAAMDSTAFEV